MHLSLRISTSNNCLFIRYLKSHSFLVSGINFIYYIIYIPSVFKRGNPLNLLRTAHKVAIGCLTHLFMSLDATGLALSFFTRDEYVNFPTLEDVIDEVMLCTLFRVVNIYHCVSVNNPVNQSSSFLILLPITFPQFSHILPIKLF